MKLHIDSFKAVDAAGNHYVIDCYQNVNTFQSLAGEEILPGVIEYKCGTTAVQQINDETFRVAFTDTEVKKISHLAIE